VAQLASVLAWGASGRPFKSDHPDQQRAGIQQWIPFLFLGMGYTISIHKNDNPI
jgi:hypothetical protein